MMLRTGMWLLLAGMLLAGCVYEKTEGGITRAPAPPPAQASVPPDRITTEDLGRLSPSSGTPGPAADVRRPTRPTPRPPGRIYVQAASFVTRAQAERMRRSLRDLGPTVVYTAHVGDQARYRVRVGPLATPARSERVRAALIRRGYGDAIIIRD